MPAKKKAVQSSNKKQANKPIQPVESANIVILNTISRKVDILNNYISNSSSDVEQMIQNHTVLL